MVQTVNKRSRLPVFDQMRESRSPGSHDTTAFLRAIAGLSLLTSGALPSLRPDSQGNVEVGRLDLTAEDGPVLQSHHRARRCQFLLINPPLAMERRDGRKMRIEVTLVIGDRRQC